MKLKDLEILKRHTILGYKLMPVQIEGKDYYYIFVPSETAFSLLKEADDMVYPLTKKEIVFLMEPPNVVSDKFPDAVLMWDSVIVRKKD